MAASAAWSRAHWWGLVVPVKGVGGEVVVIGAGVIGLTVGVELAERGLRVQVATKCDPLRSTSVVASAMIGPSFAPAGSPAGRRERVGIEQFTALADTADSGVALHRGRLASRQAGPQLPGLTPCTPDELPPGFAAAARTTLPLVDMPIYLTYLTRRLEAAGGSIVRREIGSLDDVAGEAALIANCAGLGARELVPDPAVRAVRGQQVVVENPGLEEFFIEAPFTPAWAAYWPYPDHVVLGGTRAEDDENLQPDQVVADQILERCIAVEPRLANAAVRSHQVGLRPVRETVRLEREQIDGAVCVHNYGHGGSGVTLSWGCAREAVALLLDQDD